MIPDSKPNVHVSVAMKAKFWILFEWHATISYEFHIDQLIQNGYKLRNGFRL